MRRSRWTSFHPCDLLLLSLSSSSVKWRYLFIPLRLVTSEFHRVLGTHLAESSSLHPFSCCTLPHSCSLLSLTPFNFLNQESVLSESPAIRLKHSPMSHPPSTEPLPPPSAHADPVSWITPGGQPVYIKCRVAIRGVTYLLRQEGVDGFQKPDVQHKGTAGFLIYKPGNYSCSYLTHAGGESSEPSAIVTIKMHGEC